jgi:CheY-like chemotaxis protein
MLRHLIGEDIELVWIPDKDVQLVKMDPSQINQILANLCLNARDSIVDVGKITIKTTVEEINETDCSDYSGLVPGEYVVLTVSDNGCGMDAAILESIFEPFFTTKGPGKGTGLGLATVYGIVQQNKGFVNVDSEKNLGTTFEIYLPRHKTDVAAFLEKTEHSPGGKSKETILVVEDELAILKLTTKMLENLGYKVMAANSPGEAINIARQNGTEIDLLMTDVVMPEMNGHDLSKTIMSIHPNIRRLFMSGYTADVIAHHGVLDEGVNFIEKPFTKDVLAVKVREVLESSLEHTSWHR